MADVRPLAGLRYDIERAAAPLGDLLAPPYDVIDPSQGEALAARSPNNIIRVELAKPSPGDPERSQRYQSAADTLRRWRAEGVLRRDEGERFYVYDQEFEFEGRRRSRRALFGRVRLAPWGEGDVLPHEHTRPHDKADRMALLRATRTNVSPVFMLYRDVGGVVGDVLEDGGQTLAEARGGQESHRLSLPVSEQADRHLRQFFAGQKLYVADGHHRYETALTYCRERQEAAASWSGEEPENFVLTALVASNDPGLVVRPTHRLVRPPEEVLDPLGRLSRHFDVAEIVCERDASAMAAAVGQRLRAAAGETAFIVIGLEPGSAHLLILRDATIDALLPQDKPPVWRALDVSILQYGVLKEVFGVDEAGAAEAHVVDYTADLEKAVRAVLDGDWPLAFLLNPTPVGPVLAVADAGSRMPQKSTYFYPKLATGLVLYPFD